MQMPLTHVESYFELARRNSAPLLEPNYGDWARSQYSYYNALKSENTVPGKYLSRKADYSTTSSLPSTSTCLISFAPFRRWTSRPLVQC